MSQILRDPLWQFIGAALSLLAIAISVFLFYRQRQRKSLAYQILTNTPVLTVGEEIRGKLAVSYENTPVKNVQLLLLKIENVGNLPITSTDFEQSLSICFGKGARILSHEVVNSTPRELSPKVSSQNHELTLQPLLLNPRDQVTIKCLVSEHSGEVTATGRIVGVSRIIQAKESFMNRSEPVFLATVGIISALIGSLSVWVLETVQTYAAALLCGALLLLFSFIVRNHKKLKGS